MSGDCPVARGRRVKTKCPVLPVIQGKMVKEGLFLRGNFALRRFFKMKARFRFNLPWAAAKGCFLHRQESRCPASSSYPK
jgi:hypothetical protein